MESSPVESLVAEVRAQWKCLWKDRVDDHIRAEGVAATDYDKLFVERGTVVLATRNFKLLTLRDILEAHRIDNSDRFVPPDPKVGGWNKFVRTQIVDLSQRRGERAKRYVAEEKRPQQPKKGGRGWLHV